MAKILRSESSLSRRQDELDTELRRSPRIRRLVWTVVVLASAAFLLSPSLTLPARLLSPLFLILCAVGYEWRLREIAGESKFLEGGRTGERKLAARFAEQLADDHLLLNDLDLRIGHERFQIDHLVVAPSAVFVVESKYWSGTLSGDPAAATWTQTRHGRSRAVSSPVRQVERQRRMLVSLFRIPIPEDRVYALAVFTHPAVSLQLTPDPDHPVFTPREAVRFINDKCFDAPLWTPEDQQAFAQRVLSSQP